MPGLTRRRPGIEAAFEYDPRGFLVVGIVNRGSAIGNAAIELVVPQDGGVGWIARIDPEGNPAMENGSFAVVPDTPAGERASLCWRESGLELPGGGAATSFRFFVGAVDAPSRLPVVLTVRAGRVSRRARFAATLERTPPELPS